MRVDIYCLQTAHRENRYASRNTAQGYPVYPLLRSVGKPAL
ncbi:Uncharacterised protein [Vibrio cholerae]|nr:Uncharacterised protein [Vibrio cholerae]